MKSKKQNRTKMKNTDTENRLVFCQREGKGGGRVWPKWVKVVKR